MVDPSAVQSHWAGCRHHLQIAEVAIPSHTAHVREAESFNRRVFVRIAGTVIPFEWVARTLKASRNRVGAELHHAKWRRGTRKGLARSQQITGACSDDWVDEAR